MAYTITSPVSGLLPINQIDTGTTMPNSSTVVPSPPLYPGMVVTAQDPTFGVGEFILLKGVASTVVGAVVRYNAVDFQTVLIVNTAVQVMPVAVAMSANLAGTWGWYQICGTAAVKKTAVILLPNVAVYISATAGSIKAVASAGLQIVGARTQLVTTASASGTVLVTINRPHCQSQIT